MRGEGKVYLKGLPVEITRDFRGQVYGSCRREREKNFYGRVKKFRENTRTKAPTVSDKRQVSMGKKGGENGQKSGYTANRM